MLKVATVILVIAFVFCGLYSLLVIVAPGVVVGSTWEARTGETLRSIQDSNYVTTLINQTRHLGIYALTTVIALFFILFGSFRKGEKWSWWAFLIINAIVWGYGLVVQISEGDVLNSILHVIGAVLCIVGLLLPLKIFFAKKA